MYPVLRVEGLKKEKKRKRQSKERNKDERNKRKKKKNKGLSMTRSRGWLPCTESTVSSDGKARLCPGERKNKNVKDNRKGRRQKSLQTKDGQKKQEAGMDERLGRNGRNEDEREGGR